MKRTLPLLLSTLLLLGACGAGGGGYDPTPEQQALADCTGLSLDDLSEIYGEVLDTLEAIPGAPPGATYDISDGSYTIALTLGDIEGVVSSPNTISDGIDVGETATATWALNGGLAGVPAVTGEGSFTIARPSDTVFNVSGNGGTLDGTCEFTFTGLTFNVSAIAGLHGTIVFSVTAPAGTLTGTMNFNGTNSARVVATVGPDTFTFYINLSTFAVTF